MTISNKEYVHILDYFNINIPDGRGSKNVIKQDAEKMIDSYLCKTIIGKEISTPISKKKLKNSRKKR